MQVINTQPLKSPYLYTTTVFSMYFYSTSWCHWLGYAHTENLQTFKFSKNYAQIEITDRSPVRNLSKANTMHEIYLKRMRYKEFWFKLCCFDFTKRILYMYIFFFLLKSFYRNINSHRVFESYESVQYN